MIDAKSHPILFSGAMVRAIIDGRKTQTRRVVTPHNSLVNGTGEGIRKIWPWLDWSTAWTDPGPSPAGNPGPYWKAYYRHPDYGDEPTVFRIYPRVEEGDTLWIKETFWLPDLPAPAPDDVLYGADYMEFELAADQHGRQVAKHPSIFMRREFSRLDLDVLGVRGQRVQEITAADAKAEGADPGRGPLADPVLPHETGYQNAFRALWDSINGKKPGRSWPENPPVWAYAFKPSP